MIGQILGNYSIVERIGEGGMGVVYKAVDSRLRRTVVLKLLRPDRTNDLDRRERFLREAQSASALNHSNIVTVYDVFTQGEHNAIVMEFVEGRPLDEVLKERSALPAGEVLPIALQICSALEAAHSRGIIHRDLKPGNIMLTHSGQVKLLDFGLAKVAEPAGPGSDAMRPDVTRSVNAYALTVEGSIVGTLAYMAPEQAVGQPVDQRTDLFSFGAVLYEMLSGQRAFPGDTAIAMLSRVLSEQPAPLGTTVPERLAAAVFTCLAKDASRRFQSAGDLRAELERAASEMKSTMDFTSVAVLPFAHSGGRTDVGEALADEIRFGLSKVPSLRVAARSALEPVLQTSIVPDPRKVAQQLGIALILDGTIRQIGDRVQVAAELSTVADRYQLWGERFDCTADELSRSHSSRGYSKLSAEIVQRVAARLGSGYDGAGRQSATPAKRGSTNIVKPDRIASAKAALATFSEAELARAKALLDEAVREDGPSVEVYAATSRYYALAALLGGRDPLEAMPKARWAASKAMALDATAAGAQAAAGLAAALGPAKWTSAESSLRAAVAGDVDGVHEARLSLALWCLAGQGNFAESIGELGLLAQREDRRGSALAWCGFVQFLNGEFEAGLRASEMAAALQPLHWLPRWAIAWNLIGLRRSDQALDEAARAVEFDPKNGWAIGVRSSARMQLGDLRALTEIPTVWQPLALLARRDSEAALACLSGALDGGSPLLPIILQHRWFDTFRKDERFVACEAKLRAPLVRSAP